MRKTDFDFAKDLLTQAELKPVELASTGMKGFHVTLENNRVVAWLFEETGEFRAFTPLIFAE
jgi:hypothetical protein